jgi:hypothetical protein
MEFLRSVVVIVGAAFVIGGCSPSSTFTYGGRGELREGTYRVPPAALRNLGIHQYYDLDPFPPAIDSTPRKTWEDTRRTPELYFNFHDDRPELTDEIPVLRRI